MVEICALTKDYGNNKGIFDLSFNIKKGEAFGFLGPNGAGKTTTIRHLMGFLNPDKGSCSISGLDCRKQAAEIQKSVGYIPGEITLFDEMTGIGFLRFIGEMRGSRDLSYTERLIEMFELDANIRIKKMSKGMKQKLGIDCAFMNDPSILILDEPSSGLDPLMQNKFVELINEQKKLGKTILMSSHSFEEVERTCDRIGIIKKGRLVTIESVTHLKQTRRRTYLVTFENDADAEAFANETGGEKQGNSVKAVVQGEIKPFLSTVAKYSVTGLDAVTQSLEDVFMHYYGE